jgi:UDP-N-acetylmuramate dehydrogenase
VELEEDVLLAPFTTLRIGGPARYFARIASEADLLEAIRFARSRELPIFTLGGGSNLVVSDAGFPGVVLHMELPGTVAMAELTHRIYIEASGGMEWDAFVRFVCEEGLSGVECLAGIPGLVGGSPIQNIGAYGQEVASTIRSVHALDLETLEFVHIPHGLCGFAYRTSRFNSTDRNRYIVTRVDFVFDRNAKPSLAYADLRNHFAGRPDPTPLEVYEAVRTIRAGKGMLIDPANPAPETRSAGSFFKNPVVAVDRVAWIAETLEIAPESVPQWAADEGRVKLAAAWLIERAGFPKGFTTEPGSSVGISPRHTLALINRSGTATCAELLALRDRIAAEVNRRFGVALEQEPVVL